MRPFVTIAANHDCRNGGAGARAFAARSVLPSRSGSALRGRRVILIVSEPGICQAM